MKDLNGSSMGGKEVLIQDKIFSRLIEISDQRWNDVPRFFRGGRAHTSTGEQRVNHYLMPFGLHDCEKTPEQSSWYLEAVAT